jgi:hypothetical protein
MREIITHYEVVERWTPTDTWWMSNCYAHDKKTVIRKTEAGAYAAAQSLKARFKSGCDWLPDGGAQTLSGWLMNGTIRIKGQPDSLDNYNVGLFNVQVSIYPICEYIYEEEEA